MEVRRIAPVGGVGVAHRMSPFSQTHRLAQRPSLMAPPQQSDPFGQTGGDPVGVQLRTGLQ
jgi:hypothetical protein